MNYARLILSITILVSTTGALADEDALNDALISLNAESTRLERDKDALPRFSEVQKLMNCADAYANSAAFAKENKPYRDAILSQVTDAIWEFEKPALLAFKATSIDDETFTRLIDVAVDQTRAKIVGNTSDQIRHIHGALKALRGKLKTLKGLRPYGSELRHWQNQRATKAAKFARDSSRPYVESSVIKKVVIGALTVVAGILVARYFVTSSSVQTAPSVAPTPVEDKPPVHLDYRSACTELAVDAPIYFDGEFCRCQSELLPVDPYSRAGIDCKNLFDKRAFCTQAGEGATRYVMNEESGFEGSCLCVATGRFIDNGEEGRKDCELAHKAGPSMSSQDVAERLSHYLAGLPKDVVPLVDTRSLESIFNFLREINSSRSVKVVGKKIGKHGASVYVVRKRFGASDWFDVSDPIGQQFDPRGAVKALGPVVGPFFGFEEIDEDTYTCPSLAEFKRAVKAINRNGMVVAGSAYEVLGQFGTLDYLIRFEDDGELPGSEFLPDGDQTYFFHDITLHLASELLFPIDYYNAMRRKLGLFRALAEQAIDQMDAASFIKDQMKKSAHSSLATFLDGASVSSLFARYDFFKGELGESYGFFRSLSDFIFDATPVDTIELSDVIHPQTQNEFRVAVSTLYAAAPKFPEIEAIWQRFKKEGIENRPQECTALLMKEHFEKLERRVIELQ